MKRKEIAAAQKLELEQLAEHEVAEMRREALQARERINAAAGALAGRMGLDVPKTDAVESLIPVDAPEEAAASSPQTASAKPAGEETGAHDAKAPPREAANFADIAANIAGNDWKEL
jgi:hypothetical protein